MKLLWISQNLPYPPKTGVLQRNYNLIREAAQFAEVHLVAILKQDILPDFDAETARRELGKLCRRITVIRLPAESSRLYFLWLAFKSLFTKAPFTANWTDSEELLRKLQEQTRDTRYDLVYFDTISLAGYRSVVGDVAKVLNHHNIESHLLQRRVAYEGNALRRFYFGLEARKLCRYEAEVIGDFDLNLTVSELDAQRLKEIVPSVRTSVVANGVDVDYFRGAGARVAPKDGRLIMVSGMNWFPNKDAAIYMARDIWPALAASMPSLSLTVVGASPPAEVTSLAAADSRVTATGFVDDVRPHMNEAQIYLCPMRDGGGTRLKILDALSMGVPIVATTMAYEGIDVVPEEDVLVADDPAAFVRQVKRLVDDPALRAKLSANGRAFVERNFSWPVIGRNMQQSFSDIVRARAR
jgi:glycosyltransferase involved in cell wall biosynthesis